jgi:hypothetical protein
MNEGFPGGVEVPVRRSAFALAFPVALLALLFAPPASASASTIVKWTGAGSENLPCPNGAHWVITGGALVLDHCNTTATASTGTAGTLFVHDDGVTESVGLVAVGGTDFAGDNSMGLDRSISARAVIEAASPTETPSPTTPSSPPTTPSSPPTTPTHTPTVKGRTVTPSTTGPGALAFTGPNGSTAPMVALAVVVLLLGASLLLWTRRRST